VVTRQPFIRRRSEKVRQLQTDVLTTEPRRQLGCTRAAVRLVLRSLVLQTPVNCDSEFIRGHSCVCFRCLVKNTNALVEIEVARPICLELYSNCKDLGRFMLRSSGSTIAAGLVTEVHTHTCVLSEVTSSTLTQLLQAAYAHVPMSPNGVVSE